MTQTDIFALYQQMMQTLDGQTQALQAEYRDQMQCRKGCSGCCQDNFRIRYIEGLNLIRGFFSAPPATQQAITARLANPMLDGAGKCPILVDGACSLYEHRPTLCRAYGVMVELKQEVSTCPLNFQSVPQGSAMKVLDVSPYYSLLDELTENIWQSAQSKEGESQEEVPYLTIRDFFSHFRQLLLNKQV